jgi:hypothetical protein
VVQKVIRPKQLIPMVILLETSNQKVQLIKIMVESEPHLRPTGRTTHLNVTNLHHGSLLEEY